MNKLIKKAVFCVMVFLCLLILTITATLNTASLKVAEAATSTPTKPEMGDGSSESPYQIGTAEELYWFAGLVNGTLTDGTAQNQNACAELTADIDLSGICNAAAGSWKPIGDYSSNKSKFSGNFNGKNYTIRGLYINSTSEYQGLFGYTTNSVLQNVTVKTSTVQGGNYTGAIVGYGYQGSMTNCHNEGSVNGTMYCGGIAGEINQMMTTACSNRGQVIGTSGVTGGIAGELQYAILSRCFNTGALQGNYAVGGIVGIFLNAGSTSTISDCYNQGDITGSSSQTGGIVGKLSAGVIKNCYSAGTVSSSTACGSVVGYYSNNSKVTITNCFYDSTVSSIGGMDGNDVENKAEGRTTAIFQSGEITYLLNAKKSDASVIWYQMVTGSTKDNYPNLLSSSGIVYCDIDSDGKLLYSNSQECSDGHTLIHYDKVQTCTEGHIEYWYCTACKKYFKDAAATIQTTEMDILLSKLPHTLQRVEAKEYTEETGGRIAHYHCTMCNKLFSDAAATNEITEEQTIVRVKVEQDGNITYYADLQEAFDSVEASASNMATVTLLGDIIQDRESSIEIVRSPKNGKNFRNIVLDLNGHMIKKTGNSDQSALHCRILEGLIELEIKGSGSIIGVGSACVDISSSNVKISDNVVLDSDNPHAVYLAKGGTLEIKDHALVRSSGTNGVVYGSGTLNVNGGILINTMNSCLWNNDPYGILTTNITKGIVIGKDASDKIINQVYGSGNILSVSADLEGNTLIIPPDADLTIAKGVTLGGKVDNYGTLNYGNTYGTITGNVVNHHKLTPQLIDAAKGSISFVSGIEEMTVNENKIIYAKTGITVEFTVSALDQYIECGSSAVRDSNGNTIETVIPQKSNETPGNSNTYRFKMPDTPLTITSSFKIFNTITAKGGGISWSYTPDERKSISTVKGTDINWEGEGTAAVEAYYIDNLGTKTNTSEAQGGAAEEGGAPQNAGNYYVKVKISSDDNYAETTSDYIPFTINKADNTISNKEQAQGGYATTYVYTGKAISEPLSDLSQFQLLGNKGTMKLQWYQGMNNNGTVEGLTKLDAAPSAAGAYSLTITVAEDKNYNDITMVLQIQIQYEVRVSSIDKEGNVLNLVPATTYTGAAGDHITVTAAAAEDYSFLGWYDKTEETPYHTGEPLSVASSYTFPVDRNKNLVAVYDRESEKQATVIFESSYGQEIQRIQLDAEDAITLPAGPSRYGYSFTGWSMTEEQIREQIKSGTSTVTVSPVYDLEGMEYEITVNHGGGGGTYQINHVVTITADKPEEGMKFLYWREDTSGRIVSYRSTYQFYAMENTSLTAYYDLADTQVVDEGIAEIIKIKIDSSKLNISFVTMHTVPKGCSIKNAGIVATSDAGIGMSGEGFNKDSAAYVRGKAWSGNTYRFTWTKKSVKEDETWYARAYLVFTDANGNEFTVYSDMKHANLKD